MLDRGHSVVGVDNLITGDIANIERLAGRDFVFVKHDVTNYIHLDGPLDFIYHFASSASPIDYLRVQIQTLKVGSLGTHNALGLAKAKSARFFLASTSEVYGDPLQHPQREDYWGNVNPIGPRGVYDEAKRFAEAMAMAYHRTQGVKVRIARIFNTYGHRLRRNDGRAVPEFISAALAKPELIEHVQVAELVHLRLRAAERDHGADGEHSVGFAICIRHSKVKPDQAFDVVGLLEHVLAHLGTSRVLAFIRTAKLLPENVHVSALKELANMLDGDRLCHGDSHPGNIMLGQPEPIIIDWIDPTIGSLLADVARTSLIGQGAVEAKPQFSGFQRLGFRLMLAVYLLRYFQLRPGGQDEYRRWLPTLAAARLNENVPGWEIWLLTQANTLL